MDIAQFLDFCHAREELRKRKESGVPLPWTRDPHLANWHYCNIRREDDRVTKWFRDHIRSKLQTAEACVLGCVMFRMLNSVAAGEIMCGYLLDGISWAPQQLKQAFDDAEARGIGLVGNAYVMAAPSGRRRTEWSVDCATQAKARSDEVAGALSQEGLEAAWEVLRSMEGMGSFTAYEVVTDLRWTPIGHLAADIYTWANPGPGSTRGAGWVDSNRPTRYGQSRGNRQRVVEIMREILDVAKEDRRFAFVWEMRDVEHALCEYDKYRRAKGGQAQKRRYRHGL